MIGSARSRSIVLGVALLLAVGLLGPAAAPAAAGDAYIGPIGPGTRCVEGTEPLQLPVVRSVGADGPRTGQLIRWEYRTTSNGPYVSTDAVAVGEDGLAVPPPVEASLGETGRGHVRFLVLVKDTWHYLDASVFYHPSRAALLREASVQISEPTTKKWSHGVDVLGLSPLYEVADESGACAEAPARDVQLEVWATHGITGQRTLLGRVDVNRRVWSLMTYPPTTGPFSLTVEQVRAGQRRQVADTANVTLVPDDTRLGVTVPEARAHSLGRRRQDVWWMPRGTRFTLVVTQHQQYWRPVELDGASRIVTARFRAWGARAATTLSDIVLTRGTDFRIGRQDHVMRGGGHVELASAVTATESAGRVGADVRLLPRPSFPSRTTRARAYHPVTRTVTVKDGAGLKAWLELRTRDGWSPAGRERTIGKDGRVRLRLDNDTRRTRQYRLTIWAPSYDGGLEQIMVARGRWTIRNR